MRLAFDQMLVELRTLGEQLQRTGEGGGHSLG